MPQEKYVGWLQNSTIKIDGKEIFEKGVLKVHSFEETIDCLNKWNDLKNLYATNKVNFKWRLNE